MFIEKKDEFVYEVKDVSGMRVPAYLFTSESLVEALKQDKTPEQIANVATLPGVVKSVFCMPDAHQGYGFPIGGVAALDFETGGISPGGIGYDENCGVRLMFVPLTYSEYQKDPEKAERLLNLIFRLIPVGVGAETNVDQRVDYDELDEILRDGAKWAVSKGYGFPDDLDSCEDNGTMLADPLKVSMKAKKRGRRQIGTLGAGNHFLEIQRISEIFDSKVAETFGLKKDYLAVMIHCGSRGLGHQVCSDYLREIERQYPDLVSELVDRELVYAPSGSELANDFFLGMSAAANFAWANRQVIMHNVRIAFNKIYSVPMESMKLLYDVCHNIAKVEEHNVDGVMKKLYVHRKGATRAFPSGHKDVPLQYRDVGQPVIIPGSMGTSSYVLHGTQKAMELSFGSTAHGAGRRLSRFAAKKEFTAEGIKQSLTDKGITLKCGSLNGIVEEGPECYKDIDEVIRITDSLGIAKKVAKLVPLSVVKG
ncbi:RtcB family protein [Candidatus Woesearchaeota archaeon]|nr:RtcB family protein [Candidatus Woesearchaeota archaeon]